MVRPNGRLAAGARGTRSSLDLNYSTLTLSQSFPTQLAKAYEGPLLGRILRGPINDADRCTSPLPQWHGAAGLTGVGPTEPPGASVSLPGLPRNRTPNLKPSKFHSTHCNHE